MSDPLNSRESGDNAALVMALGAMFGLSLKGIFGKLAFIAGALVIVLVMIRMVMAVPLFLAVDRLTRNTGRPKMSARDMLSGFGFGLLFLVAMLTDFSAIERLGAGLSRIVLFTYPLIVVLLSSAIERRKPSARQLAAFAVSYTGLIIVLRPDRADVPPDFWSGVGFAVLCSVTIASVYAFANPLIKRIGASRFALLTHISAAAGMLIIVAITKTPDDFALSAEAYGWIAAIVVLATVAPMMMQYESMRRIGAARVSLIGLLGPVVTVIVAWFVLGERLDIIQIGGFGLVLCGIALLEWAALKKLFIR